MLTKVTLCGSELKFSPRRNTNSKSVSKKAPLSKPSLALSARGQKRREVEEGEKLFRAVMKSRRWFLEMMSMISNQPDTFITLTFPSSSKACNRAKLSKKYFNCFTKKMKKLFPECYAVWKEETRQGRGLHFHMIARFGDHDQKLSKIYKTLNELWENMFSMDFEGEVIFLAEEYNKKCHEGYLVKKSKIAEEMKCKRLLKGKRAWGIVGKKNILFHKEEKFELDSKEHRRLVRYLKRYIEKHPEFSEQYAKQLSRSAGSLYLFPKKVLKHAIEYATAHRSRTEHDE